MHGSPAGLDQTAHVAGRRPPVADDEVGVQARHQRPADRGALEADAVDERPRERRHACRQTVAGRVGILEHAACAGSRERLGPLAVGERRARPLPQGGRLPRRDGELGPQHDLAGALQPTPVVPELERGGVDLHLAAARVRETGADEPLAEQRAPKVRVAVQAAAHRARGARPPLETGQAPVDRPAHEAVQRHAARGADHARSGALDRAVPQPHDEPPHAALADQHVRPAAEQRDGQAETVAHRDGTRRLAAAPRLQEPVRRAPGPERRARVQPDMAPDPIRAERLGKRVADLLPVAISHAAARLRLAVP